MEDRISEILKSHIRIAERQLHYMEDGVDFSELGEDGPIPTTKEAMLIRIENLKAKLQSHEYRLAQGT